MDYIEVYEKTKHFRNKYAKDMDFKEKSILIAHLCYLYNNRDFEDWYKNFVGKADPNKEDKDKFFKIWNIALEVYEKTKVENDNTN